VVLSVNFPVTAPQGNEQIGNRPAVVVGVPNFVAQRRFRGLIVVPFTSQVQQFNGQDQTLYPLYLSGTAGLTADSIAIIDQVRYVDQGRIVSQLGRMTATEFQTIRSVLASMFVC